jgi:hypothetical protein
MVRERRIHERRRRRLVSRVLYPVRVVIICLGPTLPAASSDLPESHAKRAASPLLFGLSPGGVYQAAAVAGGTGELLPRLFTLTSGTGGGVFSVALSLGSPPLGVTQHPALWSPDFPRALARRDHPVSSSVASLRLTIGGNIPRHAEKVKREPRSVPAPAPGRGRGFRDQDSSIRSSASFASRSASRFSSRLTCSNAHVAKCRASAATSRASGARSALLIR